MGNKIDMTGWIMKEHGVPDSQLIVIKENKKYKDDNNIKSAEAYWDCLCNCGNIKTIAGNKIRKGTIKSCGCLRGNFINMTGWIMKEHGVPQSYLTVIEEDKDYKNKNNKNRGTWWKCQCECGKLITSESQYIRKGQILSCGCKRGIKHRADLKPGQIFGHLQIIKFAYTNSNHAAVWECICDCGNTAYVTSYALQSGTTKSCGCKQSEGIISYGKSIARDLVGQKFGKLTVIKYLYSSYHRIYLCQCECGNTCEVAMTSLVNGATQSCGCLGRSKGEYIVKTLLKNNNIPFETQKRYPDLLSPKNKHLRYDFFINNNFLLEVDGSFHYQASGGWATEEKVEKTKQYDEIKNNYCKINNIPLKRIPYSELNNLTIEDIMGERFLLNNNFQGDF